MQTITSKTAINGAKLWYVDGKRTSRDNAATTSIANGRENLSNLVAGLTSDPAVYNDIGIVADMKSEFGDRYVEHFYFATAEDAVTAARKIVALGKQVHRLTIDNGRPYPSNIRYADTARGKLIFINGFERFNEGDEEKSATVEVSEKPATVNEPDAQTETAQFKSGKTYAAKKSVLFDSQINMTVIKRTKCYVTIQIDDDKDDIRRCKVVDEYGVEKIHLHESNAIGGDYEFSAQNVVTDSNEVSDSDGHIDGFDESAFDALPDFDEDGDGDELINPPETTAEVNDLPEVKPEFKRYGSLKSKRTNVMDSIFNHEHMTFNTHAEALAFIEKVANDTFEYVVEYPNYLIRDENDEWTYATARTFSNVNCMSPDYGTYEFTEIITADGKLDHVIFQRGFGIGAKTVKLYIEAPTDDLDEALHRVWKRLGHKHRWHIGRDSRDDPYPYYLDEDGEEVEADICDDDECREVEEQLGLIYADKRDYPGLLVSGWHAEDDPRLKDGYNESYSWREVESDYYRDVL